MGDIEILQAELSRVVGGIEDIVKRMLDRAEFLEGSVGTEISDWAYEILHLVTDLDDVQEAQGEGDDQSS